MNGRTLTFATLNLVVLSTIWHSMTTWECGSKTLNAVRHDTFEYKDAPLELRFQYERLQESNTAMSGTNTDANDNDNDNDNWGEPSFLQWHASPVEVPRNWTYESPKLCDNFTLPDEEAGEQKIIVHYHMQHNAGTNFYSFARKFVPCATRACYQSSKHCLVSLNEEVEAQNIRNNYENYGIQYVSYEVMLPPRFPLPFVSENARKGLFFTTIVRNPFKRFITYVRKYSDTLESDAGSPSSPFWMELSDKIRVYSGDNLNVRWLSGTLDQTITAEHVNIAKCRLQLFDLVISDSLYYHAIEKVLCPLNNWKGSLYCKGEIPGKEHESKKKDPMEGIDPIYIGAWIERIRPSFEIYDYARLLSYKQLKERGVSDLPELSEVPSYMDTLAKYADNLNVRERHLQKVPRVSLENEDKFHPPVQFCDRMKNVWRGNPDEVPNIHGIGAIKKSFIVKEYEEE